MKQAWGIFVLALMIFLLMEFIIAADPRGRWTLYYIDDPLFHYTAYAMLAVIVAFLGSLLVTAAYLISPTKEED